MRFFILFIIGLCFISSSFANEVEVSQLIDSTRMYWRSDLKKAQAFAYEALEECDTTNYELYAECVKNQGVIYYFDNKPDSAIAQYEAALALFKKANSNIGISKVLNNLGIIEMEQGKYKNALSYYNQSYELALSIKDTISIIKTRLNVANIYYTLGNYTKCLESSLQLKNYFSKSTSIRTKAAYYELIYSTYQAFSDVENYKLYAEKALHLYESVNDSIGIATVYTNMANGYESFNDFRAAIDLNINALKIFSNQNYSVGMIYVLNGLGNNYRNTKEYELSTKYFLKAYQKALVDNNKLQVRDCANEIYINALIQEDLISARTYQSIYDSINNVIIEEKIHAKIADYQVKYETVEKEQEIQKLTSDKKQQELILINEKKNKLLILIIAVFVLFVGVCVFVCYRVRQRRKRMELRRSKTEIENKLLRTQMNPHFLFNSLNSIQNFILTNEKQKACNYLSSFSKLIRNILENSRKTLIPLDDELETLEKYLSLEQLRFKDKLRYSFEINPDMDTSEFSIPPMILQPYIENAIIHGIAPKQDGGLIKISIKENVENNTLECCIEDNGIGRQEAGKKEKLTKSQSLGMLVTRERLKQLYNNKETKNDVVITDLYSNGLAAGTKVKIILPI